MTRILKYSSIIILYFFTGCLFYSPINEAVNASFTFTGNLTVNNPISLLYEPKDDKLLELKWKIESIPTFSKLEIDSFLPSNDIYKRIFIPDIPGDYTISLEVKDEYGSKDLYVKTITIKNNLPTAIITSLNNGSEFVTNRELSFDASNSYDIDYNQLTSYKWSIIEAPKGSTLIDYKNEDAEFKIMPDLYGNYRIKLIVTDTNGLESYTSLSFYIHENSAPKILEETPSSDLSLIPIKSNETKEFLISVIDDSTQAINLNYKWEISINDDDFFLLSSNNKIDFNANTYGVGDFISLKLTITDNSDNKVTKNWRIIIIE